MDDAPLVANPDGRQYVTDGWQSRDEDSEAFVSTSAKEMAVVIVVLIILAVLCQRLCRPSTGMKYTPVSVSTEDDDIELELEDMAQTLAAHRGSAAEAPRSTEDDELDEDMDPR